MVGMRQFLARLFWRVFSSIAVVGSCAVLALAGPGDPPQNADHVPLRLYIDLTDGSHLVGIPLLPEIVLKTSYGEVKLVYKQIESILINKDPSSLVVQLQNGDRIRGSTSMSEIKVKTLVGTHAISLKWITSINVAPGGESVVPKDGLILYYSFNQDDGDTVKDRSGRGNDGKVHAARWVSAGKRGGAYEFNGRDSFIESASPAGIVGGQAWSISFWVKVISSKEVHENMVSLGKAHQYRGVVGIGSGGDKNDFLAMNLWGSDNSPCSVYDSGIDFTQDFVSVIATYDGKHIRIHLNGVQKKEYPIEMNMVDQPVRVGGRTGGYTGQYLNGIVDEVAIYNRALSELEIRQIYNTQR
jgi:hypothetical protein